jgi:hypothetical protein
MVLLVLIEIALLCVLVLLIRVAIRRGIARIFEMDDDFAIESRPERAGPRTNKSVGVTIKAVSAREEKNLEAS